MKTLFFLFTLMTAFLSAEPLRLEALFIEPGLGVSGRGLALNTTLNLPMEEGLDYALELSVSTNFAIFGPAYSSTELNFLLGKYQRNQLFFHSYYAGLGFGVISNEWETGRKYANCSFACDDYESENSGNIGLALQASAGFAKYLGIGAKIRTFLGLSGSSIGLLFTVPIGYLP